MKLTIKAYLIGMLVFSSTSVLAETETSALSNVSSISCQDSINSAIPLDDLPSESERQGLVGCSSEVFYYGDQFIRPDLVKARKCAYLEREAVANKTGGLAGSNILAMIYANGEGVVSNPSLAIHFVCEQVYPIANILHQKGKILSPEQITAPPFDLCKLANGTDFIAVCSSKDKHFAAWRQMFTAQASLWPDEQKQAYLKLQQSAEAFIQNYGALQGLVNMCGLRICMSGQYSAFVDHSLLTAWQEFYRIVQALEQGQLPPVPAIELTTQQRKLDTLQKMLSARISALSEDENWDNQLKTT